MHIPFTQWLQNICRLWDGKTYCPYLAILKKGLLGVNAKFSALSIHTEQGIGQRNAKPGALARAKEIFDELPALMECT